MCVSDSGVGLLAVCKMVYAWYSGPCPRSTLTLPVLGTIRVCGIDSQWSMAMTDVHIQVWVGLESSLDKGHYTKHRP